MNRQKPLPELADRIEWLNLGIAPPQPDEDTPDEYDEAVSPVASMSITDYHNEYCTDCYCSCRGDL